MRKVFIKGFFFVSISLLLLYTLQCIVNKGLKKSRMQYYATWNDIYDGKINADVLICGESRAKLTYSPRILDSVLGMDCFNLGINGAHLPLQMARLKIYLQHNKKPKYIIQSVDFHTLCDEDHLVDYDQFLPYLDDTVLTNVINGYKERFTIPELYFPMFRYNNHLNLVKEGIFCYFGFKNRASSNLYKGFAGASFAFDDFFIKDMHKDADAIKNCIDPKIAEQFEDYLKFCKANDIKLVFVYEPVMKEVSYLVQPDSSAITRALTGYAKEYNIPFLMYFNDSIGLHKELFIDHVHLRGNGAEIFSREVAQDLKAVVKP